MCLHSTWRVPIEDWVFFHVDVEEKAKRFKLWTRFDNCGVFTIEEGTMSQEDIIKNLKRLFLSELALVVKATGGIQISGEIPT